MIPAQATRQHRTPAREHPATPGDVDRQTAARLRVAQSGTGVARVRPAVSASLDRPGLAVGVAASSSTVMLPSMPRPQPRHPLPTPPTGKQRRSSRPGGAVYNVSGIARRWQSPHRWRPCSRSSPLRCTCASRTQWQSTLSAAVDQTRSTRRRSTDATSITTPLSRWQRLCRPVVSWRCMTLNG